MKCEYCDNPVPSGATRCPSCGAVVFVDGIQKIHIEQPATHTPVDSSYIAVRTRTQSLDSKNKWVYILLGVFLGEFGIHNFYTGYIGRGVVKLLITILSFGYVFWISWIWAIVEICTVRIDSRGVPFTS